MLPFSQDDDERERLRAYGIDPYGQSLDTAGATAAMTPQAPVMPIGAMADYDAPPDMPEPLPMAQPVAAPTYDERPPAAAPNGPALQQLASYSLTNSGGDVHDDMPRARNSSSDSGGIGGDGLRTGGLAVASLLDLALNRGKNTGALLGTMFAGSDPYEQQKRDLDLQYRRAQIAHMQQGRAVDPFDHWYKQELLRQREEDRGMRGRGFDQADQRIGIAQAGQDLKQTAQDRDLNPDNPQLQASKRELYAMGARPGSLDGLDQKATDALKPFFIKDLETRPGSPLAQQDITHGAASAGANSAATKQDRIDIATAGAGIKTEQERQEAINLAQVPGWHRRDDAPEIKATEAEGLRKTNAAAEQYAAALRRLRDVNAGLTREDYAKSAVGINTPAMAKAIVAHSNVTTKQRVLENLGTPQAAELKMVNKQVPTPDSFEGAMNGDAAYQALLDEYDANHETLMANYGYERGDTPVQRGGNAAPAAKPKAGKRRVTPAVQVGDESEDQLRKELGI